MWYMPETLPDTSQIDSEENRQIQLLGLIGPFAVTSKTVAFNTTTYTDIKELTEIS